MTSTIEPSFPNDPELRAGGAAGANKWRTLISVSLGIMMVALDGTVVSVANPTIGHKLNASLADLQWVTNGYLLSIAVLLVFGGRLGDRFGRKRLFMLGMAGFALGSFGCALSGSIDLLILFRVVQGAFGAMMLPATLACLRAAFPPDELERAVGIWGGTSALATASGPIIGGLLVQHVSWESIFLLNLPLGAVALVVAFFSIQETKDVDSGSGLDPPGVLLLSGSLFALAWGLIKSQTHGWGSAYTLGFLAVALVLMLVFILWEKRVKVPLIPLELFRSPSFSAGVVLVVLGLFALYGVLFFMTLYLQRVHGYSPVQAGVRLLPLTAVFSLSSPLGGVLTARFGPRVPLFIGMVLMGAAFLGLRSVGIDTSYRGQWPWFVAVGVALGLIIVASTQAIVGNAPVDRAGVAGGIQQTGFQLGGVIGTSVLGTVIVTGVTAHFAGHLAAAGVPGSLIGQLNTTSVHQAVSQGIVPPVPHMLLAPVTHASYLSFLDGLHKAMLVGAIVSFVGALVALLVQRGHELEGPAAAAA
ncbi:MAG: MFS transporter [Solirubrobacteraceae bacterium]